jgi:hypothetical protein
VQQVKVEESKQVRYSTAQLQEAVDAGKITQAAALEIIRLQERQDIEAQLEKKLQAKLEQSNASNRVQSKIDEYADRMPGLRRQGSEEWTKAAEAYRELIQDGHDEGLKTELAALRIAFPDGGKAKEAPKETTAQRQRSVESAGTSSGRTSSKKESGGKWPSFLEQHRIDYYEQAIQKGRYSGRADPMLKKELDILEKRHKEAAA